MGIGESSSEAHSALGSLTCGSLMWAVCSIPLNSAPEHPTIEPQLTSAVISLFDFRAESKTTPHSFLYYITHNMAILFSPEGSTKTRS